MIYRNSNGVSVIAKPLLDKDTKSLKKALKLVKKASKSKVLRRGVREVQKTLRKHKASTGKGKEQKTVCILAGDTTPIDVITHIPILCEEKNIPYVFVPSKSELGAASQTKRSSSCVMVVVPSDWEHAELVDKVVKAASGSSSSEAAAADEEDDE